MSRGDKVLAIIFAACMAFGIFCIVMAVITGIQLTHDSGVCDGKGGTWIDGKCYAHVEVMH